MDRGQKVRPTPWSVSLFLAVASFIVETINIARCSLLHSLWRFLDPLENGRGDILGKSRPGLVPSIPANLMARSGNQPSGSPNNKRLQKEFAAAVRAIPLRSHSYLEINARARDGRLPRGLFCTKI
jgi:hypothetical protein